MTITYKKSTAKEIARTIDIIRPAVAGLDANTISTACIAIAIMFAKPDIAAQPLIKIIKSVSEYIQLHTAETTGSVN